MESTTSTIQLRKILTSTTNNQESIQKSASEMMKYYDKGVTIAVTEWRNALQTSSNNKLLTLLYVANEVLQISKRNRGSKFLEAFSPILKSSLIYICEQDRDVVEKVRRTAKIWGDRRVFSVRFVSDVVQALNVFRDGGGNKSKEVSSSSSKQQRHHHSGSGSSTTNRKKRKGGTSSNLSSPSNHHPLSSSMSPFEDEYTGDSSTTTPRPSTLQLNVNLDQLLHAASTSKNNNINESKEISMDDDNTDNSLTSGNKRRRSETSSPPSSEMQNVLSSSPQNNDTTTSSTAPQASSTAPPKVINIETLLILLQKLDSLQKQYQQSQKIISKIDPAYLTPTLDNSIVGDELSTMYTQILKTETILKQQLSKLHTIAQSIHEHEQDIIRYIPYLKLQLQNDEQELIFCNNLLNKQLPAFETIHTTAKDIRDEKNALKKQKLLEEEENLQQKLKEEERKQSLKELLVGVSQDNVKPGMVWNSTMREYVNVHDPTNDSWRDH